MKAAYIEQTGAPENIIYGDLPTPEPTGKQVLIKMGAVAVNPIDTYIRNGANYWELPVPYVIGCDVAGVVEAVGPDASRFTVGDRVWGSNQGLMGRQGTFAEYSAIDEGWLYPTPAEVSDEDAAAMALVGITAHLGLVREAQLAEGERLVVIGGSGGVGSTVVQIAKIVGAQVTTTAGSDEKAALCRDLGADQVINYKTDDLDAKLAELVPDGANVWWETRREPDFDLATAHLAQRGRFILMAGRDARPEFPVGPFYVKGCSLHGFVMFTATPDEQRACADDINTWFAAGRLKPRIDRILPLAEAAEAHQLQEQYTVHQQGSLSGKIVLVP
ncbi:MAG: NADPH:quinone reductase [Pirellulales bacterium]|nr:NADPH:quinone reductase [Pirellulales bacterium]